MFYIIVFAILAVVLVVVGATVLARRQRGLEAVERHNARTTDAKRRKRKAERTQSRHDRRKRH